MYCVLGTEVRRGSVRIDRDSGRQVAATVEANKARGGPSTGEAGKGSKDAEQRP